VGRVMIEIIYNQMKNAQYTGKTINQSSPEKNTVIWFFSESLKAPFLHMNQWGYNHFLLFLPKKRPILPPCIKRTMFYSSFLAGELQ
jgi:hypothetical protein